MSKFKITGKVLSVRLGREETQLVLLGGSGDVISSTTVATPAGAVDDGMIRNVEAVRDMLKTAVKAPEFKRVKQVVFTLCTTQVITEVVNTPDLPPQKMEKLIQSNADMYFPVDTKDYRLVWEVLGPREGAIKEVDVQLWAVPLNMLNRYYSVANGCGLSVAAIDYCGHSMATAVGASFNRSQKSGKKAPKQKKKLDLNAEISFGKKQAEPEGTQAPAEAAPVVSDTQLYLLLESDILGMTFVQNGRVLLQRFIRCGSQPSYQFGELAMMVEYFRSMDQGGNDLVGIVAGELADDRYLVEELEDTLGITVSPLVTPYDPKLCLCVGAARTNLDFGVTTMNSSNLGYKQVQSQLWQYGALLGGGLALVAIVLFTMNAKLGWDTELAGLRNEQQTLMLTSAKYSGFADNYNEYATMYENYSADWDLIFSSVKTYNNNLVLVMEELEELIPEKSSVTSLQMVSNAMNVTFACSNKEEAAYLIMALREMEYADLVAVSSLSGGGRGAATSYGYADEKPPVEGGSSVETGTVVVDATVEPTEVPQTEAPTEAPATEAPATEAPATEAPATEAPTEAPAPETTAPPPATEAPAPETTAPATEAPAASEPASGGDMTEMIKGYLKKYLEDGTCGIPMFDAIIETQVNKFLATGKTDYPEIDAQIETTLASGALDKKIDELLNKYITDGTTGNTTADSVLLKYMMDKTTGVAVLDKALEDYIWAGKADEEITILYSRYIGTAGKTGIAAIDALIEESKVNGTTGIQKLDERIKTVIAKYNPNETPTDPTKPADKPITQPGIITQETFLASLQKYMSTGTTGIPVLDQMIKAYLNPAQGQSSSTSNKNNSGGGSSAPVDTRVFFSAVLGYNADLMNAEQGRKGLNYTDKLLPLEVDD